MNRKALIPLVLIACGIGAFFLLRANGPRQTHYTGFVEGEEKILRSEVHGRLATVHFSEGQVVPANAVIATIDERDIRARVATKRQEIAVFDAEVRALEERVELVETTWQRELDASKADLRATEATAGLAARTHDRESSLAKSGASTTQQLDDARTRRDQAHSSLERAQDMVARTEAQGRQVALARLELTAARERRQLAETQLAELLLQQGKHSLAAPAVDTIVQTQFLWPAELAQPGAAVVALLDPKDKYVQTYLPVTDAGRIRVGQRVAIELDAEPGRRIDGEISFIADKANFTPEKIETRSDRMGQVYRVKVRILHDAERLRVGSEGNVYLLDEGKTDGGPA